MDSPSLLLGPILQPSTDTEQASQHTNQSNPQRSSHTRRERLRPSLQCAGDHPLLQPVHGAQGTMATPTRFIRYSTCPAAL